MIRQYTMDVYPRTLFVAIGASDEALNEYFKDDPDGIEPMKKNANAYVLRVTDGKHGGVLVRFPSVDKVTQGIVAHECFHAVMFFCSYLGITFTTEDNEHVAYMIQWAVNKCFEAKWEFEGKEIQY